MYKRLSQDRIGKIRFLRQKGYSLPEISEIFKIGKTTVFRHIKGIEILPQFRKNWLGKRGGSIKRKLSKEKFALEEARNLVKNVSKKEKLLFLCALYWAEGNKKDFILTNSDPNLIQIFVNGLREVLGVSEERIQVSLRLYEDINREESLYFWSKIVKIPRDKFLNIYVLPGKKKGKLQYGMCRIRVKKGGDLLKKIFGINKVVVESFVPVAQRIE